MRGTLVCDTSLSQVEATHSRNWRFSQKPSQTREVKLETTLHVQGGIHGWGTTFGCLMKKGLF